MTDIREVLLDLQLVQTDDRPEGMIVLRRGDVPPERREEADAFVIERRAARQQARLRGHRRRHAAGRRGVRDVLRAAAAALIAE
jgi:hypothetical protein